MQELIINGKSISFNNPNQIINMGGPWVGELLIGNHKVIDNVIIDNLHYNNEHGRLYFIKYNKISRWQKDNYFSIYYVDILTDKLYIYDLKFDVIFIKGIDSNYELTYYEAFHDQDEKKIRKLSLKNFNAASL